MDTRLSAALVVWTSGQSFFTHETGQFRTAIDVPQTGHEVSAELMRELASWHRAE